MHSQEAIELLRAAEKDLNDRMDKLQEELIGAKVDISCLIEELPRSIAGICGDRVWRFRLQATLKR